MQLLYKFILLGISIILALFLITLITLLIHIIDPIDDLSLSFLLFIGFPISIYIIFINLKKRYINEPEKEPSPSESNVKPETSSKDLQSTSHVTEYKNEARVSRKWTLKGRALETIQWELEDLIYNNIELVASAYRGTVTSNSFGKKNYTKFKKELLEYLLDNTMSDDVIYYAEHMGDFGIPDQTMDEIERAIDDFSKVQNYKDDMDPYEYEHFCAEQFLIHGWDSAEATSGSSDQGVDVIAKRGNEVLVGQCKKYAKPVGNSAVQEVVAGMGYYGANIGVVISNNSFTNSAEQLAAANNIKLIHHSEIKNL
jgi:restriction system protein